MLYSGGGAGASTPGRARTQRNTPSGGPYYSNYDEAPDWRPGRFTIRPTPIEIVQPNNIGQSSTSNAAMQGAMQRDFDDCEIAMAIHRSLLDEQFEQDLAKATELSKEERRREIHGAVYRRPNDTTHAVGSSIPARPRNAGIRRSRKMRKSRRRKGRKGRTRRRH